MFVGSPPDALTSVPLSSLTVGTVLAAPIFDRNSAGTKLLGRDVEIDANFLQKLAQRGIATVVVDRSDLAKIHAGQPQGDIRNVDDHHYYRTARTNRQTLEIDQRIADEGIDGQLGLPDQSIASRLGPTPDHPYEPALRLQMITKREHQVTYLGGLFTGLVKGGATADETLSALCRDSVQSITEDRDLFLALGINPFDGEYPVRHGLHVCQVAIAIGVMLGLDDQSLVDLGTGSLLHDVGMMKMQRSHHTQQRKLESGELIQLAEHPVLTLEALASPGIVVSRIARTIAYQMHERCDGSGYPRGRDRSEIHPLARIAAVADTYVALVSNRPHRPGMLPYFAMEKLLRDVAAGVHDDMAVRGLLNAISLFPIGSCVQTQDGRIARVVRANGESYATPVVEFWDGSTESFTSELVDLAAEPSIRIVRASRPPQAA